MWRKTLAASALILAAALGLSSCAGNTDDAEAGAGAGTGARSQFNDADVAFVTDMIRTTSRLCRWPSSPPTEPAATRCGSSPRTSRPPRAPRSTP